MSQTGPKYKVLQSLVGESGCYRVGEIIEWHPKDPNEIQRMLDAGIFAIHVEAAPVEITEEPETPESTRAKSRKKEVR